MSEGTPEESGPPDLPSAEVEQRIEAVVEDFLEQLQRGEEADVDGYVAAHAELAPSLERRLRLVEQVFRGAQSASSGVGETGLPLPPHDSESSSNRATSQPPERRDGFQAEQAVRLQCPHCGNRIQLVHPDLAEVTCRACGSSFQVDVEATVAWNRVEHPAWVGRFEIVESVGRGAFGVVYKARDTQLKRTVAVKVPRSGYFASDEEEQRFLREARHAARLRHPHIVQVYEVGRQDNVPYIVSDFIDGMTLADLMTGRRLSFRETAELVAQVSEAVDCAHQQKVIHRDLKPSNILIDHEGQPYVTDFGLARVDEGEITVTLDGEIVGTPAYMSPEQAAGEHHRVDARSDVYGLGIVLYRLLCGELPFRGSKRMMIHQVLYEEPRPPRTINEVIPRDLETITLKAAAKDIGRRYASARALSDDLRRWLAGEPIHARPVGRVERLVRWCRRKPLVASLSAAILLLLLSAAAGGAFWGWRESVLRTRVQDALDREQTERDRADENAEKSQQRLARLYTTRGVRRIRGGDLLGALPWLTAALETDSGNSERTHIHRLRLNSVLGQCPRLAAIQAGSGPVVGCALSPDGGRIAAAYVSGEVLVVDAEDGRLLAEMRHGDKVWHIVFSPDGRWIATASSDKTARIWNADTGASSQVLKHDDVVFWVTFSPDGRRAVTASRDDTAVVWEVATGVPTPEPLQHEDDVRIAEFSPDGSLIATASWHMYDRPAQIRLWNARTGEPHGKTMQHDDAVRSVAFEPAGNRLLSASRDKTARVWDTASTEPDGEPLPHDSPVATAFFSPDGSLVVTVSVDGGVHLWDARTGSPAASPIQPSESLTAAAMSPDGRLIATASRAGIARVWHRQPARPICPPLPIPRGNLQAGVRFTPDGRRVVTYGDDGSIKVWDLVPQGIAGTVLDHQGPIQRIGSSPNGDNVITCGRDCLARVWNVAARKEVIPPLEHSSWVMDGAFSPAGTRIATACADGTARLWDSRTGTAIGDALLHEDSEERDNYVLTLTFSPEGRKLLTGCADGRARLWDVATGALDFQMPHADQIIAVSFSPDGRKIATCSRDSTARIWRVEDGQPVTPPLTHGGYVMACVFSPDSRLVVTASQDNTAVVWDAETGRPVGEAMRHQASVYCAAFSPDGRSVLTAGYGGEAGLWRHQVSERAVTFMTFGSTVDPAHFIQDGKLVLTRSSGPVDWLARRLGGNSAVQVWDVTTGDPVTPALARFDESRNPAITHENSFVVTGSSNGIVRIWPLRPDKRPAEDLARLATVLSGRRIDPVKGEVLVPPQELRDLHRELRSKYPGSLSSSPLEAGTWQRLLASSSIDEQKGDAEKMQTDPADNNKNMP